MSRGHFVTYAVHGLRIRSEIALPEPVVEGGQADVLVRLNEPREIDPRAPLGEPLVSLDRPGFAYAIVEHATGYTLRFDSLCEFEISTDLSRIEATLTPGEDPELLSIFLTGNVLAFLLGISGDPVLHASAVELGGYAVALAGETGSGKSTLSALLCATGAALISDDLLRLGLREGTVVCHEGTRLSRLRTGAAKLADHFPAESIAESPDGRLTISMPRPSRPVLELGAIVLPVFGDQGQAPVVERLGPREALIELLSVPRLIGWRNAEPLRRQFPVLVRVAERVPVLQRQRPLATW